MTNKTKKQLIRIASFLQRVQNKLLLEDELSRIENLIEIDYCNESMIRTIASELQTATDVHLEKVWNEIDKHLQSNQSFGMSRLPSKSEIIDLIHKKRNFSQHSGECPLVVELESYFETSQKFLNKISTAFFGRPINTFSIIDLVESSDYKNLLSLGIEFAEKNDFMKAVAILKLAYLTVQVYLIRAIRAFHPTSSLLQGKFHVKLAIKSILARNN